MLERIQRFLVVPACLLVASPLFVITLTAQSDFNTPASSVIVTPTIEESTKCTGLPEPRDGHPKITQQVKLNPVPHVFSYLSFDRSSKFVSDTFRGLTRRNTGTWRFDQVLSRHEIELKSDPYEMVNIQLASDAIDGTIVMPGDTFSFNGEVGIRSEEKGYKPGLMFQQGQAVKGVGGGICIVSTALFNAALKSGLKIIERSSHSGVPRYIDPGFDAAVVYGSLDLKIKNDTKTPFVIRAVVEDDILAVTLLGRKTPGVEVELATTDYKEIPYKIFEKPDPSIPEGELLVKQKAKPGFEVTTVRIFRKNGKVIKQEIVGVSHYLPRHKIILIPMPPEGELPKEDPLTEEESTGADTLLPVKPVLIPEKPVKAVPTQKKSYPVDVKPPHDKQNEQPEEPAADTHQKDYTLQPSDTPASEPEHSNPASDPDNNALKHVPLNY